MKQCFSRIFFSNYAVLSVFLLKTVVYYMLIEVDLTNNPLVFGSVPVFGMLFFALASGRGRVGRSFFLVLYTGLSILMFADSMYFNYYNQTVSVKQLWQAANVAKVPQSFIATLLPASFVLILDIPVVYYLSRRGKSSVLLGRGAVCLLGGVLLLMVAINPGGQESFTKINRVGFFTSHVRDVYLAATERWREESIPHQKVMDSLAELSEETGINRYEGIAAGRNLILVQVEALQSMMLQAEYEGQELMPRLNQLLEEDTLYFDRYYSTIGKGNTADAEFSTLNGLYPVIDRECYALYRTNTYRGLPWLLREQGYHTFAMHGYLGDFWGRKQAYPYQGIENFYSMEDMDDREQIGMGISDVSLFRQAVARMQEQEGPFFSFLITLTNHHPYELEPEMREIALLAEHEDTKFGNYLQTVRYTDDAIGVLLEELQNAGLYENSVIVFYGDHHGLNKNMDDNDIHVSEWLGREYDYDEMLRVPLVIHIPGMGQAETISTVGGQVDFLPTIANLMGLEVTHPFVLGQDLCNASEGFVAFTAYLFEGSFAKDGILFEVSREGVFEGSRAWKMDTGEALPIEPLREDYERALQLKALSREILEQDLIRTKVRK